MWRKGRTSYQQKKAEGRHQNFLAPPGSTGVGRESPDTSSVVHAYSTRLSITLKRLSDRTICSKSTGPILGQLARQSIETERNHMQLRSYDTFILRSQVGRVPTPGIENLSDACQGKVGILYVDVKSGKGGNGREKEMKHKNRDNQTRVMMYAIICI